MPTPSVRGVHADAMLSNISVAYVQQESKFIASRVFPSVNVEKMSGTFYKYNREDWLRDEAQLRADATESAGSGYTLGQDNYSCKVWAFHKDVGDQVLANADNQINPLTDAARFVAGRLLMRQERDWASKFFKQGVWANDLSGVTTGENGTTTFRRFDDYANSDPIAVVENAKELVAGKTGYDINTAVIGKAVYNKLKQHPDIIDRIKYTSSENITLSLVARLLELDRVFIGTALYNSAAEGAAESLGYVFDPKSILLTHTAGAPGLLVPSAGYTFTWNGVSDGTGLSIGTRNFRMELLRAQRIESQIAWDNKVVAPDLGVFLKDVVS